MTMQSMIQGKDAQIHQPCGALYLPPHNELANRAFFCQPNGELPTTMLMVGFVDDSTRKPITSFNVPNRT